MDSQQFFQPSVPQGSPQPPPTPPPAPTAVTSPKSSKKKPILLTLLCLVLTAGAAYGTYLWQHKKVSDANAKIVNLQSQLSSLQKQINAKASESSSSPTANWKTYTLKYEKLTFKYPSTWTIQDSSGSQGLSPNTDSVTLTASDGYQVTLDDGWDGGGDPLNLATDNPVAVKFVGNSDYLVFLHPMQTAYLNPKLTGLDSNSVGNAILMSNPVSPYNSSDFPQDKNAHGDPKINNGGSTMLISGGYTGSNAKSFATIDQAKNDSEFKNFSLIIQSMHY